VLDEAAIRRVVGGAEVMREQLAKLEADMARPNIMIQVIPGDTGEYAALAGGFELLSMEEGGDVAYVEGASGTGYMVMDHDLVRNLDETYDLARCMALRASETKKLIREIRESL
jgi:hypothetical protein